MIPHPPLRAWALFAGLLSGCYECAPLPVLPQEGEPVKLTYVDGDCASFTEAVARFQGDALHIDYTSDDGLEWTLTMRAEAEEAW